MSSPMRKMAARAALSLFTQLWIHRSGMDGYGGMQQVLSDMKDQ